MRASKRLKNSFPFSPPLLLIVVLSSLVYVLANLNTAWDKKSRFSLLLETPDSDLLLLSVEPSQEKAVFLLIPANTQMDLPYGYKTYPASSIYRLGELDKTRGGGILFKKSIETTLGVKIDGFIIFSDSSLLKWPKSRTELAAFKKSAFSYFSGFNFFLQFVGGNVTSDLNFSQKLAFFNSVRRLRSDQIQFSDLGEGILGKDIILPDQSKVIRIDPEAFDFHLGNNFQDFRLRTEEITLEVVNASGLERIASQFARVLNHLGSNVIAKTTAKENIKEVCTLYFLNEKSAQSLITEILKKDYACEENNNKVREFQSAADIIIILGEEFIK